jgi:sugar lactone lactonase YvrE
MMLGSSLLSGQNISTIAGTGSSVFSGDGGPAVSAGLPNAGGGAFDRNGNYYFVDAISHRVRKISVSGIIETVAGNGSGGFIGDGGAATNAQLNFPQGVAVDTAGNIYIADANNNRVRKVSILTGIINTIVGTGTGSYGGDGSPATNADIWNPQDVYVDKAGNIYIADMFNYRIRKVSTSGIITTIAGVGTSGYSGDGGSATLAQLGTPIGITVDDTGSLYIADPSSFVCRVRKVNTLGVITTIAGNGSSSYIGDGIPATNAAIVPFKVAFDKNNNLFIADRFSHRVYKTDIAGVLTNVAGTGTAGDSGDGSSALSATLNYPTGVALDECSNLYIATSGHASVPGSGRRIRKVSFNPTTTPSITITGVSTATVGATVTVNAAVSGAGSVFSIKWFKNSTLFSTTSTPTTTYIKGTGTDTITARVVPAVTTCYDSAMSVSAHLVTEGAVGLQRLTHKSAILHLYPNPAQHILAVSCDAGLAAVSVVNIVGAEVARQQYAGATAIKLSVQELPQGIYVVHATATDGSKVVERFVKE